jgi:anti-sigma factor RsiW
VTDLSCKQLVQGLDDYLDGDLSAPKKLVFDRHLAECTDCTQFLETYNAGREQLGTFFPACDFIEDAPEGLIKAILSAQASDSEDLGESDGGPKEGA